MMNGRLSRRWWGRCVAFALACSVMISTGPVLSAGAATIARDIPGPHVSSAPALFALDSAADIDAVFELPYFHNGERLTVKLWAPEDADFRILLFSKDAMTVLDDTHLLARSSAGTYPRVLEYTTGVTGAMPLWLNIRAVSGSGTCFFTWSMTRATKSSLSASKTTIKYAGTSVLTARLLEADGASYLAGRYVDVMRSFDGTSWSYWKPLKIGYDGSARVSASPTRRTHYKAMYAGEAIYFASESKPVAVTPRVSLTTPVAPSSMTASKPRTVSGYLKPRHRSGTRPVRIYLWRKTASGSWKSYGYVRAVAENYSTYSRYKASVTLPRAGTWRLRAYAPADSRHAATWSSGYDYVKVK